MDCHKLSTPGRDLERSLDEGPFYLSGYRPGHSIVPECEVFLDGEEGSESKFESCKKNPGHGGFIPVKDFKEELLPEHMRKEGVMLDVKYMIARTVLIKVKCISLSRPDTFYDSKSPYPYSEYKGSSRVALTGTGFIMNGMKPEDGKCPCLDCKNSGNLHEKYWSFPIATATHVVFDNDEAEWTIVKCFYDSEEDQGEVVTLYGMNIESRQCHSEKYRTDFCDNLICITHDEDSAKKVNSRIGTFFPSFQHLEGTGIIVSHPHGCSKKISVGNLWNMDVPIKPKYDIGKRQNFPSDTICYFSSGNDLVCHHLHVSIFKKGLTVLKGLFKSEKEHYHRGTTFTLPKKAEYAMRYRFDKNGFTFPPGTKFISGDGVTLPIPENTVFESEDLKHQLWNQQYAMSYDIPTCPGSSGSLVPCYSNYLRVGVLPFTPHSGHDGLDNCNRSCCSAVYIIDYFWLQ